MASDRDAVETIVTQHGFQDDVAYGNTKLFVRTPRSLFTLEQERAALIPILVLFLQKVSPAWLQIQNVRPLQLFFCFVFELRLDPDEEVMI